MKECLNYNKLDDKKVHCYACSHKCSISDGKTGLCGVRQNIKGTLYSLVYEKAIAVNIDPVEKKPLFHFLPGTYAYSFGTLGCNFRCKNCQNYDISQIFNKKGETAKYDSIKWGIPLSPKDIVKDAIKHNCESIAYTYTEPTIFLEYALDTMKLAKKSGLKNVWVSNGFMSEETLDLIMPFLDAINIDIKSFDDSFYMENCGGRIEPILENCKRLSREKIWLEITTLIIPSLSDDLKMLEKIASFIKTELGYYVPWHISAFSGAISWQLKHIQDTPIETIKKTYQIGKKTGLKYIYGGNVWDPKLENTYCPKCGKLLIERIGYKINRFDKKGKCACGKKISGIF